MKKIFIGATILFFILLVVLTGVCLDLYLYAEKPARSTGEEKTLALHPGQGLKAFAEILAREEIIVQPLKFKVLARLKGQDKRIKAGEYRLSGALSPTAILEKLVAGEVLLHKLTIPEGYNLRQIAKAAASQGFGSEAAFYQAAADPELALKYEIDARTLEGYLFPDTYYFPRSVTPRKIIDSMVRRFWEVFKPAWKKRAAAMGLTVHEVVTLASIIEKETGAAFERPIISSVFYNRLKKGMRLETDPTVIYGIKNFDGNLTRKHLKTPGPYNTYKIKGLPPGPIASPGAAALEAALHPADTRYYFFVSKKDATHYFSTNLKEHNNAVRKFQLSK